MPDTYENMAIIISAQMDAAASKTAIDLQTFITTMESSGMGEAEILDIIQQDIKVGGRIFSQYKNGVKNAVRAGVLGAGNVAIDKTYEKAGVKFLRWIVVSDNPCPDCLPRHNRVETAEFWRIAGEPKSGFSVCGMHCYCQLVPESYKGENLDAPVKRTQTRG